MKFLSKSIVLAAVGFAAINSAAALATEFHRSEELCPYFGISGKFTQHAVNGDWKGKFPKANTGASAFVGGRIAENMGLEAGYDWGRKNRKDFAITDTFFGNSPVTPNVTGQSQVRLRGYYADFNHYKSLENDVEFVLSAGVAMRKPIVKITGISTVEALTPVGGALSNVTKGKSKIVPRLGFGVQSFVSDNVGVKGMLRWEKMSEVKLLSPTLASANISNKLYKNGFSASLAAFYQF